MTGSRMFIYFEQFRVNQFHKSGNGPQHHGKRKRVNPQLMVRLSKKCIRIFFLLFHQRSQRPLRSEVYSKIIKRLVAHGRWESIRFGRTLLVSSLKSKFIFSITKVSFSLIL